VTGSKTSLKWYSNPPRSIRSWCTAAALLHLLAVHAARWCPEPCLALCCHTLQAWPWQCLGCSSNRKGAMKGQADDKKRLNVAVPSSCCCMAAVSDPTARCNSNASNKVAGHLQNQNSKSGTCKHNSSLSATATLPSYCHLHGDTLPSSAD
jgi:hypothetical protein